MGRTPDFIIIGAMKSATSSLHEQLARQPGIFMSTPKEPNFFSDDDVYAQGMAWYTGLFSAAPPDALCGESSTHYTKLPTHPHTVNRIAEAVPDARFVYVMRHPIDRLVSHYIHEWTTRVIDAPIDEAVTTHPELIEYGLYTKQLAPYIEQFGAGRILPVFFDCVNRNSQAELERVCRHIGYTATPAWVEDLGERNVSKDRLRKSRLRDALVYAPGISFVRKHLVPQSMRDRVKGLWQMRERPALGEETERMLKARFDEDLATLGAWLGVPLTCDTFKDVTQSLQTTLNPKETTPS